MRKPDERKGRGHFLPVETALGLTPANVKTTNQLLTDLVDHYLGRKKMPEGTAMNAVAQNLPWLPTDALVVFLAKPHSNWVEHVVVLDPANRELMLDQNPYLKTKWDRQGRYEALLPGGRVSVFVPLREISVDEIVRKGALHYEVRKIQVNMRKKQQETQKTQEQVRNLENERQQHFWPLKPKNDPRMMKQLPPEGPVPHLTPLPPEDKEPDKEPETEDHFVPVPENVVLPDEDGPAEVSPMDEETIRKMNILKEVDDLVEKKEMVENIKREMEKEQEEEQDETEDTEGDEEQDEDDEDQDQEDDAESEGEGESEEEQEETEEDEGETEGDGDEDTDKDDEDVDEETEEDKDEDTEEDEEQDEDESKEQEETEDEDEEEQDEDDSEGEEEDEETEEEQEETDGDGDKDTNKDEEDQEETEDEEEDEEEELRFKKNIRNMSDQEMMDYFAELMDKEEKPEVKGEDDEEDQEDEETEEDTEEDRDEEDEDEK